MEPQIYEVKTIGQGRLYIMPCPKAEQLKGGLDHLAQMGITKVVSLLEIEEATHLGAATEGKLCQERGMQFIQFPIRDRRTPAKPAQFRQLVENLSAELHDGSHIAIHCYAGIGRTGLLAGSLMILNGLSVGEAVEVMSDVRGHNMPQTQEQYEYLLDFHANEEAGASKPARPKNWFMRWLSPV